MRFVAVSHTFGQLQHHNTGADQQSVLDRTIDDVRQYGTPVDFVLRAGQISLHSDLLLHGSEANNADRRRCGPTLRYCTADVRAAMDWYKKGVVVRGVDTSGHWANPDRPEMD